jgi:UDP-MurNAc hydroxylase
MRITFLGHAGLFIETDAGSVLCDPWFNPAYFGSWFPFPSNEGIDPREIGSPDYLYVSHAHRDHLDPAFLADRVSKDARVVLPDYPVDHLERELRELGFRHFLKTRNSEPLDSDGLRFAVMALVAPSDGPTGDSALVVDDGTTRILNQNDAHPVDLEPINALGPFHGHFLQFSGAIWFPMVYAFPEKVKDALGRRKRANEQERALTYADEIGASTTSTATPPTSSATSPPSSPSWPSTATSGGTWSCPGPRSSCTATAARSATPRETPIVRSPTSAPTWRSTPSAGGRR